MIRVLMVFFASLGVLAAEKPNVVFIMVDDMGYADLGCYGGKVIATPNVDRLAEEGMWFTDVYAGSTVCAPSRSVLMTGQHTGHTTVRGNFGKAGGVVGLGGGKGRVPLRAEDVTVAEVMQGAGYVTGMVGKWGLGEPGTTGEPRRQGWDFFFGHLNQRRAHSYYPDYLWRNEERVVIEENRGGKKGVYSHALFTEEALGFVRRGAESEKPFFLYLPYTVPHDKLEPPSLGGYAGRDWKREEKAYASMVSGVDTDVGKLMGLLELLGEVENTVVFFCSDNGAARRWEGRFDSSGVLRGRKRDLYEGGIRTPMVVRWPGVVPAGRVSGAVWSFADVLPTLAEIGGGEVPEGLDGESVVGVLKGGGLRERFLYWESFEGGFRQAARRGKWKVVRPKIGAALELYDLEADVGEATDVAGENGEVVRIFEEWMEGARTESAAWPVGGD